MASSHHSRRSLLLTMSEAEEVMEKCRYRDYWIVDYNNDNSIELQGALDALYNSTKGNNYVVDYLDSQSGTRLVIQCVVCNTTLASYDPFHSHDSGKSHMKVRQNSLSTKDPNIKEPLQIKPMNALRGIFPPGSLENKIDRCTLPALGLQFVYMEVINQKERYTCQLCMNKGTASAILKDEMFEHLTSKFHNKRYFDLKFFPEVTPHDSVSKFRKLEEFEGRIHNTIIDFSKYRLNQASGEEAISTSAQELEKKPEPVFKSTRDHQSIVNKIDKASETNVLVYSVKDLTKDIHNLALGECPEEILNDKDYIELLAEAFWMYNEKLDKFFNKHGRAYSEAAASTYKIKQLFPIYSEERLASVFQSSSSRTHWED
ncbi:uncharacterized protein [Palaemon carinicauda]